MSEDKMLLSDVDGSAPGRTAQDNTESGDELQDPVRLMDEFHSLYLEKINKIDEKFGKCPEAKIKVLQEWVSDLTDQNRVLIKTVNDLENEALERVKQIDVLANDAKESLNQDASCIKAESERSSQYESKMSELRHSLEGNESCLKKAMSEITSLQQELSERDKECLEIRRENKELVGSQKKLKELEVDLQSKNALICQLKHKTQQLCLEKQEASLFQEKVNRMNEELQILECKIKAKDEKINELETCLINQASNSHPDPAQTSILADLKVKEEDYEVLRKSNEKSIKLLQGQRQKIETLTSENIELHKNLECKEKKLCSLSNKEDDFRMEIRQLKNEAEYLRNRIKENENIMCQLENNVEFLKNENIQSTQQAKEKIKLLHDALKMKDCELQKHMAEHEKLKSEICHVGEAFKKREDQMKEAYQSLTCQLRMKNEEIHRICTELSQSDVKHQQLRIKGEDPEIEKLKFKLKDVQMVLTGEIADKHDEIRRLKDDIKELEEKLLQSEKQTHFRDDLIKQLRKEVKHGRAKESLAEMLGLKGTPRATMKTKIENLNSQIEELKGLNMSLESRLEECNLPAVLAIRSRLNQAEGSLLAMCNKMDYVRRYLENLKGDEELSVKCGIEALLSELRDDVEWNRQTRRNLSLDEGTSVIVINHRSRSLPDNSLHRIPVKSQSEVTVTSVPNRGVPSIGHIPVETFQECKTYVQNISDVEYNFNETNKEVSDIWCSLQMWSEGSGDHLLKGFGDIIRSYVEENEELARLATQVGSLLEQKEEAEEEEGIHNLDYLKGNLVELGRYLTKANLVTTSDSDISKDDTPEKSDELGVLSKKITMVISDSLSLICDIKRKKNEQVPSFVKECLQDIMKLFSSILGNKKRVLEKLVTLQKQQVQFIQSLAGRVSEFNKVLFSHNESAEILKGELQKLFGVLLSKENQIKNHCNEIHYLKTLLPSTSLNDNPKIESSSLRKVSSNKDLQVTDNEELIHNLRSLNYTLRRSKISRSSPAINCSEDLDEDLTGKLHELGETISTIKGNLSTILIYLVRNQDKMSEFEEKSRNFVQTLAQAHTAIISFQDVIADGQAGDYGNISSLDEFLNEATFKVEQLLNAVEIFLCDSEKPDLNLISETLRRSMMKLVYIGDLIKKSALHENSFIKNLSVENEVLRKKANVLHESSLIKGLSDENEDLRKKMKALEERVTEVLEYNTVNTGKDNQIIQELREDLMNANKALNAIHEEYSQLKIQKKCMETENQKVMEELQAKISSLQEAATQVKPNETDGDSQLVQILNQLRSDNQNLQSKVDEAQNVIRLLQLHCEEKKVENSNLKKHLEEAGIMSELQDQEVNKLHLQLISHIKMIDEIKLSESLHVENCKKLTKELEDLKQEKMNVESNIKNMQDELIKKNEEVSYRMKIVNKQKENLTKYIKENQAFKRLHDLDEKQKFKLEDDLKKLYEDLKVVREREIGISSDLIEKKQLIYQLKLDKVKEERLQSYIQELETIVCNKQIQFVAGGDNALSKIEKQEEVIEILTARLKQMSQYISERDEIIKLIEHQLQASTEFMLNDSDLEGGADCKSPTTNNSYSRRVNSYKVRLQHAIQQNWLLVSMVNKLQNINHSITGDPRILRKPEIHKNHQ